MPPARDPSVGGQCPRGLFALSAEAMPSHGFGGRISAVTLPTKPCRSSPAGPIFIFRARRPQPWPPGPSRPWPCLVPPAPLTSPLASLDLCNGYLAGSYRSGCIRLRISYRHSASGFQGLGWHVPETDPLRLTLHTARSGLSGKEIAGLLRQHQVECECSSRDEVVLMVTPENHPRDLERVIQALGEAPDGPALPAPPVLPGASCIQAMTPREALFSPQETIPTFQALGRICGAPTVACPRPFQWPFPASGLARKHWRCWPTMMWKPWMWWQTPASGQTYGLARSRCCASAGSKRSTRTPFNPRDGG